MQTSEQPTPVPDSTQTNKRPTPTGSGRAAHTLSAISSGWRDHTCGLREDGTAVCWGLDSHGMTSPPEGETFAAISSGDRHTCGLRLDGTGCAGAVMTMAWRVRRRE